VPGQGRKDKERSHQILRNRSWAEMGKGGTRVSPKRGKIFNPIMDGMAPRVEASENQKRAIYNKMDKNHRENRFRQNRNVCAWIRGKFKDNKGGGTGIGRRYKFG